MMPHSTAGRRALELALFFLSGGCPAACASLLSMSSGDLRRRLLAADKNHNVSRHGASARTAERHEWQRGSEY
jgi:hypothetical protein